MNLFHLLLSPGGRISRLPFWICTIVFSVIVGWPEAAADENSSSEKYVALLSFLLLWPALAVQIKRWHDRDKSGWWCLINLVPLIGTIWVLVELGCLPGTSGENQYGEDPLES